VVQFDGDKLAHEHLYWDQASVLVQLGLLDPAGLPVVGVEGTRSVLDRSIPLNGLIHRAQQRTSNSPSTQAKETRPSLH
jgi:carboxymethylenebutenolidase